MSRPLILLSLCYVLGIFLGRYSFTMTGTLILLCGALVGIFLGQLRKDQGARAFVFILLLFLAAGSLACQLAYQQARGNIRDFSGTHGTLVGMVADEPLWRESEVVFVLEPESLRLGDQVHRVTGNVRVTLSLESEHEDPLFLGYGEKVSLRGVLYEPRERRNPGGFDYRAFLDHQGVAATFYTSSSGAASRGISESMSTFQSTALFIKERLSVALRAHLPAREGNLLTGLIFGERRALDPEVEQFVRRSGVSHLLAVSGLHVGLVAALLWAAGKRLKLSGWAAFFLITVMLFTYTYLTGMKPATLRAFTMITLAAGALCLGRRRDLPTAVAAAALITLFYNPLLLFSVGFQLSYAATLSILLLASPLEDKIRKLLVPGLPGPPAASNFPSQAGEAPVAVKTSDQPSPFVDREGVIGSGSAEMPGEPLSPRSTFKEKLASLAAVTLAAQIGVLPLTAYHFGEVSVLALATNLLVLPVMALVLGIGLISSLLALFFPAAGGIANLANYPLLAYMLLITGTIGALPFSSYTVFPPRVPWLVLYYSTLSFTAGGGLSWIREKWRQTSFQLRGAHLFIGLFLMILLLVGWQFTDAQPGELEVVFLDVGQGDAIYIGTPDGKQIMLDGGGCLPYLGEVDRVGRWVLLPFLAERRVRELDMMIITHPHEDHFGGFLAVLEEMPVGVLVTNADYTENENYQRLLALAQKNEIPREIVQAGARLRLGNTVQAAVLGPPTKGFQGTGSDINNNSLVLRLTHGQNSMLLTGDAETAAVDFLLREQVSLQSDILKVPHHGGRVTNLPFLLEAVSPQAAVITVGSNPFGHPHADTLTALEKKGIDVYRTDHHGAVLMRSDGLRWKVETMIPVPSARLDGERNHGFSAKNDFFNMLRRQVIFSTHPQWLAGARGYLPGPRQYTDK